VNGRLILHSGISTPVVAVASNGAYADTAALALILAGVFAEQK
jgi:hypothetical protein